MADDKVAKVSKSDEEKAAEARADANQLNVDAEALATAEIEAREARLAEREAELAAREAEAEAFAARQPATVRGHRFPVKQKNNGTFVVPIRSGKTIDKIQG